MLGENQFETPTKDMCADRRLCLSPLKQSPSGLHGVLLAYHRILMANPAELPRPRCAMQGDPRCCRPPGAPGRVCHGVLKSQVGSDPRVPVQQDAVFVLWDKISFDKDSNNPSNPQRRCRAVGDVAVARMGLPYDLLRAVGD
jgi:hypothetical protein